VVPSPGVSSPTTENQSAPWVAACTLWTLAAIAWATANAGAGSPGWLPRSLVALGIWAVLVPLVIWIDQRLPVEREALAPRLALHLPLSVAVTLAFCWLFQLAVRAFGAPQEASVLAPAPSAWLVYSTIVGSYLALDAHEQMRARTLRTTELERLLAQSRIETLRTQLNPHFLFNALNAISAHVEGAPRTARWMLEQLGDLLRLSLDHADEQEIPLQQELAFIDRYLKLQKIRFDNRLDVIVDVEPPALRALVPTFILQPLLENSIRHGIARRSTAGLIEIQAWHENGSLHLSVRDDGPGLPVNWDPERGLGVGLKNTRERLRRLYGDAQSFEIAGIEGSGVRVDLMLPYRGEHLAARDE
jgi:two-component system, LytTR family, sensor kinase